MAPTPKAGAVKRSFASCVGSPEVLALAVFSQGARLARKLRGLGAAKGHGTVFTEVSTHERGNPYSAIVTVRAFLRLVQTRWRS